jgi:Haemolymph juvenile hormone binding protein (JHBP)
VFSGKYKIDGLDSIDPMVLDKIKVLQGDGPVNVNASLSKVKIFGFSKVELVQNQVSAKDYSWITFIKLPKIRLEANYRMQGQILIIPLNVSFFKKRS